MRLAHARQGGTFDPSRAWENSPDAYRSDPARAYFPYTPLRPGEDPAARERRNAELTARHAEHCQPRGNVRSR